VPVGDSKLQSCSSSGRLRKKTLEQAELATDGNTARRRRDPRGVTVGVQSGDMGDTLIS